MRSRSDSDGSARTPLPVAIAALVALVAVSPWIADPAAAALAPPADESVITWSVRPADGSGVDGRSWVELEVEPGSTVTEHLAIRNLGGDAVTFFLAGADGYFTPTGRFNMLASGEESTDAGTWIDVADTVTVPAGGTEIVPFVVAVPAGATPGDHAAGIAASIFSAGLSDGTTVGVESRVGFRVMVRVKGAVTPALQVAASGTYHTEWSPFDPGVIALDVTVANAGNVRIAVDAASEWVGRPIAPASTDGDAMELLPGDERTLDLRIPEVWPLGPITVPLVVEQSVMMPDGTVEALDPVTRSVTVWAIPLPQAIVVLAAGLVLAGVFWGRRRRRASIERLVAEARDEGRREAQSAL